jgi:hypothetical protein
VSQKQQGMSKHKKRDYFSCFLNKKYHICSFIFILDSVNGAHGSGQETKDQEDVTDNALSDLQYAINL